MASEWTTEPESHNATLQREDDNIEELHNGITKNEDAQATKKSDNARLDASQTAKDLTTYALRFLANASNESLGACLVGLGAITYFVLGRVGLILIGVVGGVILHAVWDNNIPSKGDGQSRDLEARKRRETGLDILSRVLELQEKKKKNGGFRDAESASSTAFPDKAGADFIGFQPKTKEILGEFTDAVIRDYVKWWYGPILPKDTSFPSACRQTLTHFLRAISNQISRKRPADTFLDFVTNASSIVIVFLSELSTALRAAPSTGCAEAVHQYVFENPESSLANVLDQEQQDKKLKRLSDDILQNFLDVTAYSCEPVKIFLRQVLAGLILESTIISCSRPEFVNEWIIYALEDEQRSELVQAIDDSVGGATINGSAVKDVVPTSPPNGVDVDSRVKTEHKRTVSRAEDAMDEAMQEAKRLSALIASEEANKTRDSGDSASIGASTTNSATPTSSRDNFGTNTTPSISLASGEEERKMATSSSNAAASTPAFTTFDQIISSKPIALQSNNARSLAAPASLTLHNATVSIFDDALPGEKTTIKAKPTIEYLLQIEPASWQHPGWMIARRYPDFENMHEVLRRIAVISGVTAFTQRNQILPSWKNKTKATLRIELEAYLRDALSFDRLAESEGMKRFLEKDQGLNGTSPGTGNKGGFGFPSPAAFETMGKGMLDVLASAPKGVAGGGKAVVGGVAGVFGGMGQKKTNSPIPVGRRAKVGSTSATGFSQTNSTYNPSPMRQSEEMLDAEVLQGSQRSSSEAREPINPPLPTRPGDEVVTQMDDDVQDGILGDRDAKAPLPRMLEGEPEIHLPPPPSEIEDDYKIRSSSTEPSLNDPATLRASTSTVQSSITLPPDTASTSKQRKVDFAPLTIQETSVAVELFFATINELYALSSAWTLRLTLLNAAKSFLLRPGNPNLEAIRQLLQSTLIESQSTDEAIATHIRKTRENALPTEAELKAWPPLPSDEEKEQMRKKARKLLVEKGMPTALTSVMGAAASGEALGKVFDCLQVPEVARGLVFALVLQAVRAVTQ